MPSKARLKVFVLDLWKKKWTIPLDPHLSLQLSSLLLAREIPMCMLNVSAEVQKYFPISEINSFEGLAIVLVSQNTCSFMYVAKLGGPGVKSDGRVPTGQCLFLIS